jgi:UDP-N-acetylmuramate--alanine ligase
MTTVDPSTFAGPGAHIHIVGIGGAGMSAIARVLLGRGVYVSGSDRQTNPVTHALQADGATIFEGHAAGNIAGADVLLISSAVKDDNPEVSAARAAGLPILKRRDLLPLLMGSKTQIAVAGTHGKTTTTALIVHLLRETGRDPSYIVGGLLLNTGDNAHTGSGDAFVIEADEYDYMFLGLAPTIAVLTNVEHDHPDIFPALSDVMKAFRQFIGQIQRYDGLLIACADDSNALALASERRANGQPTLTYSLGNPAANWIATPGETNHFGVSGIQNGHIVQANAQAALAGDHNLRNTLAALAAVCAYGVPLHEAIPALVTFQGTGRRFEIMGQADGITVISDYGHHPTALRATLQAARQRYPNAAIWAVWQPHTYSRTRLLADEFAHAFARANHALVTDIYASREQPGASDPDGGSIARLITATGHPDARHSGNLDSTAALLCREARPGDVVIIFSAGDAPRVGEILLAERR